MTDDDHDDDFGYYSEGHEQALRLILSTLRFDWTARDVALDEIGDCPDCQREVILFLTGEACSALVGDRLNEAGDGVDEAASEAAVARISELLADILDEREHAGGCEEGEHPPE